jgi:hypothetical protein
MYIDINNILVFSSLVFITNVISGIYNKKYIYALLFLFLIITSIIVHSVNNIYTNCSDKIVIGAIIVYGIYCLFNNFYKNKVKQNIIPIIFIIITFLFTGYLYTYGFCIKDYCFHPKTNFSRTYHMLLHFICCIGNHFVIFLI